MDKALNQSLTKQNIKVGFKGIGIWPFNPKAMENKTQPLSIYIVRNSNGDKGSEDHYSLDEQASHSHIEEKDYAFAKLFNIAKVVKPSTIEYNHVEQEHWYYVEMPHCPCLIDNAKITHLPINIIDLSPNL